MHKYKFTNTQIQPVMRCRKYPTCVIFLKSQGSKDIKNYILDCQIHKYKCSNTQIQVEKKTSAQIQHITKWQKYPTYGIFFNSSWFKDIKNDNPKAPKCSDPRSDPSKGRQKKSFLRLDVSPTGNATAAENSSWSLPVIDWATQCPSPIIHQNFSCLLLSYMIWGK